MIFCPQRETLWGKSFGQAGKGCVNTAVIYITHELGSEQFIYPIFIPSSLHITSKYTFLSLNKGLIREKCQYACIHGASQGTFLFLPLCSDARSSVFPRPDHITPVTDTLSSSSFQLLTVHTPTDGGSHHTEPEREAARFVNHNSYFS